MLMEIENLHPTPSFEIKLKKLSHLKLSGEEGNHPGGHWSGGGS